MVRLLRLGPYALLAAIAAGLAASWDRLPARARKLLVAVTIGAQWLMALLFGLAAVPRQGPGLVVAGAGLGLLFLPVALIVTYAGKAPPMPQSEPPPPPGGWLFVPRENGNGLQIAPGHPRAWQAVAIFAAGLVAIIAVGMAG
jgi:hypothetical protein